MYPCARQGTEEDIVAPLEPLRPASCHLPATYSFSGIYSSWVGHVRLVVHGPITLPIHLFLVWFCRCVTLPGRLRATACCRPRCGFFAARLPRLYYRAFPAATRYARVALRICVAVRATLDGLANPSAPDACHMLPGSVGSCRGGLADAVVGAGCPLPPTTRLPSIPAFAYHARRVTHRLRFVTSPRRFRLCRRACCARGLYSLHYRLRRHTL
jgi:hypothetical protein